MRLAIDDRKPRNEVIDVLSLSVFWVKEKNLKIKKMLNLINTNYNPIRWDQSTNLQIQLSQSLFCE